MKSIDIDYRMIKTREDSYFYGANSERGFVMTGDREVHEENCDIKVIIKGGPGTGKSTVIRKFADHAKEKGYDVSLYYCSSDPDSLDAAVVKRDERRLMICDGTAPHVCDPIYPGAASFVFDVTAMFDFDKLHRAKDKIIELTDRKRVCFEKAYASIEAAHVVRSSSLRAADMVIDREKLRKYSQRIASRYKNGKGNSKRVFTEAISMKGAVMLDTHLKKADKLYVIEDNLGCSASVINEIRSSLDYAGVAYEVAQCPFETSVTDSVFIPSDRVLFTILKTELPHKNIKSSRFIKAGYDCGKSKFRFTDKCARSLLDQALVSLSEASDIHFELEGIYSSAVNFKSVDKNIKERLFGLL